MKCFGSIPPTHSLLRYAAVVCLLLSAAPAPAVDTLRVTTADPFLDSWRWSAFDLDDYCRDVFEDRDGNMWFALNNAVRRYDGYTWTVYSEEDGLPFPNVRTIGQSDDGAMWFGTARGVVRFDSTESGPEAWKAYTTEDGLAGNSVGWARTVESRDGSIWVGSSPAPGVEGGGISRFDGKRVRPVDPTGNGEKPGIYWIQEMRDGRVWFLSDKGRVYTFDGASWESFQLSDEFEDQPAARMVETANGDVWFARLEGLSRLQPNGTTTSYPINGGSSWFVTELLDGTILSVTPVEGSDQTELAVFNGSVWRNYSYGDIPILGAGLAAMADKRGGVWFWSRFQTKVHRLDHASERWRIYRLGNGLFGGTMGPNGRLWFYTEQGAVGFEAGDGSHQAGDWTLYTSADGLFDAPIVAMSKDSGIPVWFHHGGHRQAAGFSSEAAIAPTGYSRFDGRMWSRFPASDVGLDVVMGTLKATDGADWL